MAMLAALVALTATVAAAIPALGSAGPSVVALSLDPALLPGQELRRTCTSPCFAVSVAVSKLP